MRTTIKKILLLFLFCLLFLKIFPQGIAIGEWRDHLPYNSCVSITEGDGIIYCATKYAVFSYNESDNSITRLTKVNSLSDIGVSVIKYHKPTKTLIIAYTNGNLDLMQNNIVTNISDIKNKLMPGYKSINNILIVGNTAYLSCGFGIVVLDLVKKEIKDTYYIGLGGEQIQVFDMTFDGTNLYAATETGVFGANINDPNLADYNEWTKHTEMPHSNGKFNIIEYFHNKIYANNSNPGYDTDTLFVYNGSTWSYFDSAYSATRSNIHAIGNNLIVINNYFVDIFDTTLINPTRVWTYNPESPMPVDAIIDNAKTIWIADNNYGMVKTADTWNFQFFKPNGPSTINAFNMSVENSNLWVAPGGMDGTWNNVYNRDGLFSFINENWNTYNSSNVPALDTIYDIVSIKVNPANPSDVFAGTWSRGLLEFNNQSLANIYCESNSTLKGFYEYPGISGYRLRVGGICFDTLGNMWVTNSGQNTLLNVKKSSDGKWKAFDFSNTLSNYNSPTVGDLVIDQSNQKWIILPRDHGIIVFNDGGTIDNTSDDQSIQLTTEINKGALPSANIFSIAKDLSGAIWIGTDQGIAVFYTPENVFSGNNFDSQQILVNEGGYWQPLLGSETVTAIAVDGSNRKWLGTQKAGVFLMSADGTQQLLHFTEDNSPLFSNSIYSIAIDQKTGEVFFGTDMGIVSYKGTATQGGTDYTNVLVYPNPVTEDYTGTIAIRGLVANADVKITDISGTLIYQTTAEGGQAVWNGKNYSGEKAKTGVYLVFCSNTDGSKTLVTKIMIIN